MSEAIERKAYVISDRTYNDILEGISHGLYFRDLKVLQGAIDHRGAIPKRYFYPDERNCSTWGDEWRSKAELREIRAVLVEKILAHIVAQNGRSYKKKMPADHYARYFHALAILKVPKDVLHKTRKDYIRNIFLDLWMLDDGTDETWRYIDGASWTIAEINKSRFNGRKMIETLLPEE